VRPKPAILVNLPPCQAPSASACNSKMRRLNPGDWLEKKKDYMGKHFENKWVLRREWKRPCEKSAIGAKSELDEAEEWTAERQGKE